MLIHTAVGILRRVSPSAEPGQSWRFSAGSSGVLSSSDFCLGLQPHANALCLSDPIDFAHPLICCFAF